MSLRSYLTIIFLINCAAWLALVTIMYDEHVAPGYETRLVVVLPVLAGMVTWQVYGWAKNVKPEDRTGFWAYRHGNLMMTGLWVLFVGASAYVLVGFDQ